MLQYLIDAWRRNARITWIEKEWGRGATIKRYFNYMVKRAVGEYRSSQNNNLCRPETMSPSASTLLSMRGKRQLWHSNWIMAASHRSATRYTTTAQKAVWGPKVMHARSKNGIKYQNRALRARSRVQGETFGPIKSQKSPKIAKL